MPHADPTPTAALRGVAVGALVPALAVAAHGIAGGGYPSPTALTLLFAVCAGVGALTATLTRGPGALVGALGVGQVAAHAALALTAHTHTAAHAPTMVAAHAAATLVCAALIATSERLHPLIRRTLRVVLRAAAPRPSPDAPRLLDFARPTRPVDALLRASISRRGPPALV